MIGFNRRFAPMVEELKQLPNKRLIQLQKNRIAAQETTEFVVYDLFLHLVDTAVYLLDEPITQVNSKIIEKNDYLELAMLHLETANQTAILTMDLRSGANTEQYQVTSEQGTYEVRNLTQMTIQQEGQTRQKEFGDWTNTLEKRGFEPMIMAFFEQIQHTQPNNQQLKQTGVYQSHELCEQMIRTQLRHLL